MQNKIKNIFHFNNLFVSLHRNMHLNNSKKEMNRNSNCRYWALLLMLMVWLPVAGQTKVYSFDAVIEKTTGNSESFNISLGYPVLKFTQDNQLAVYTTKGGEAVSTIPCLDIKKLTFSEEQVLLGDANKDGKVTITDAVGVVNNILGNPSADFNGTAADVNFDNKITITDAVGVVNVILGN